MRFMYILNDCDLLDINGGSLAGWSAIFCGAGIICLGLSAILAIGATTSVIALGLLAYHIGWGALTLGIAEAGGYIKF